jgi:light-regulated signal transduction histidine kinase (bacteriophytochrome)
MAFLTRFAQILSQLSFSGIKLARSVTEVGRVNAELTASIKELEAFSYSVSHDLRAPLRHISGFSKMLLDEYNRGLPPEAQHYLERINQGTQRMGLLVDELLNLSRIGRQETRLQVTGLSSIVEEVLGDLAAEADGRVVEWKIGNLPYVECDPVLMRQVFQNLLANALKFTRPREIAVIEVGQTTVDEQRVIFVRDNGVGFSMKYADKLFGVFQEDFEGTGVGLATVQRIVQKHGGRIWVQAELDNGATFFFTLGTSTGAEGKAAVAGG